MIKDVRKVGKMKSITIVIKPDLKIGLKGVDLTVKENNKKLVVTDEDQIICEVKEWTAWFKERDV